MGIQTMGSQGGGGGSGGGQQSQFRTLLGRQSSPYGLTLNEVQNHLGEPLQGMNLDELLRNVLPPEEDRPFTIDLERSSSRVAEGTEGGVTLSRALSKRTVDEVWREIQRGQGKGGGSRSRRSAQESHPTLGEMTLEDFLAKAGVVAEGPSGRSPRDRNGDLGNSADSAAAGLRRRGTVAGRWSQQYDPVPSSQQQWAETNRIGIYGSSHGGAPQPLDAAETGNIFDSVYSDNRSSIATSTMGALSETQTRGRKRVAPEETVETAVDRKHIRMIKNRESAARSRARKQAYTNELENKVSRLEEENERLKKQKKLDRLLYNSPPPEPTSQLRRTSSAPF